MSGVDMAADTNFFKDLFGIDVVPRTPDDKKSLFIELVCLFDSLHDFGSLGSVYDYVTKSDDGKYITCKKTIFNHLRNGYSQLVGKPNISFKNSQLHCYSTKFHLKSSLTKAKLEDAFYTYAKDHLHGRAIESNKDELTFDMLTQTFGPIPVFSIDTQKKLGFATNRIGLTKNMYQTYDMEKVCDPAPHSKESRDGMHLLIENYRNPRIYTNVTGVERVTLQEFKSDGEINAKIKIDLVGNPGQLNNVKMNDGAKHINNISKVNTQLRARITTAPINGNINTEPKMSFYTDINAYTNPSILDLKNYIYTVRRTLAQKRLGDQLQALACMKTIEYTNGQIQNPIFVSIDRMAIAFAIANGVNCIYSNRDSLTLFKGASKTVATIRVVPTIGSAVSEAKRATKRGKPRGGSSRNEEWEILEDELQNSPYHILNIFMYCPVVAGNAVKHHFNTFAPTVKNIDSVTCKDTGEELDTTYYIRTYSENPDHQTLTLDTSPNDGREHIVYLSNNGEKWSIYKDGAIGFTLINLVMKGKQYESVSLTIGEILADLSTILQREENDAMEGGSRNKDFLKVLAQYDLLTLVDTEQMRLWYDEFYTQDNGIPFYSPTFYEVNAFFQEVFLKPEINYMSIYSFLESKFTENTYAQDLLLIMNRILEYMDLSADMFTENPSESELILLEKALAHAKEKSDIYKESLNSLKGQELYQYIFENDITPMYFYRKYQEIYSIKPSISKKAEMSVRNFMKVTRRVTLKAHGGKRLAKHKRRNGSPRRRSRRNSKSND